MVACDLCDRRAYGAPGAAEPEVYAAFAARGWRRVRGRGGQLLTVCRGCARHLGPNWTEAPSA